MGDISSQIFMLNFRDINTLTTRPNTSAITLSFGTLKTHFNCLCFHGSFKFSLINITNSLKCSGIWWFIFTDVFKTLNIPIRCSLGFRSRNIDSNIETVKKSVLLWKWQPFNCSSRAHHHLKSVVKFSSENISGLT